MFLPLFLKFGKEKPRIPLQKILGFTPRYHATIPTIQVSIDANPVIELDLQFDTVEEMQIAIDNIDKMCCSVDMTVPLEMNDAQEDHTLQ